MIKLREGWWWEVVRGGTEALVAVGPVNGDDPESRDYATIDADGCLESEGRIPPDVLLAVLAENDPDTLKRWLALWALGDLPTIDASEALR